MEWDTHPLWRKQIERRVYELGALVHGNLPIQAERIADVVEQIDQLRSELQEVREIIEKARTAFSELKKEIHRNGGERVTSDSGGNHG